MGDHFAASALLNKSIAIQTILILHQTSGCLKSGLNPLGNKFMNVSKATTTKKKSLVRRLIV